MKRGILTALMLFAGIGICACGKSGEQTGSGIPQQTVLVTAAAVSGQAAGEEDEPVISDSEAFSQAEEIIKGMTLEEKIGQMFMVHLSQLDETRTYDGNQYKLTAKMRRQIKKYHIGGVFLTANNIDTEKQTKALTESLKKSVSGSAMYVAAEEEAGGDYSVSRETDVLSEADLLTPEEMGEKMDARQVYDTCYLIASELEELGINFNLAPVADVASEKNKEYAKRCLGTDPDEVEETLESFVKGMDAGGIGTTLKFFPGVADVSGDFRTELLENTNSLMRMRSGSFSLYSAGIAAGADAVMMSSVSVQKVTVKKIPAFMSTEIVTNLLREEIGFDGVIMTPYLNDPLITGRYTTGFAVVEAVKAGCDMLILPENWQEGYEALIVAVKRGDIDEKVINTAVLRILKNKILRGILVLE